MLIADIVCKHNVSEKKMFNGYYGCTLWTMRGKHRFQAHFYPHKDVIIFRKPGDHFSQAQLFESGEVEFRRQNKEDDPEIESKGVQGYPRIFQINKQLPLTSPIDTMHQLLKGVAKDLFEFFLNWAAVQLALKQPQIRLICLPNSNEMSGHWKSWNIFRQMN